MPTVFAKFLTTYQTTFSVKAFSKSLSDFHSCRVPRVAAFSLIADEISGLTEWLESRLGEGVKPKEIAIFGRTETVLHDGAEPVLMK